MFQSVKNVAEDITSAAKLPPLCVFYRRTSGRRQILCRCSRPERLHTSGRRNNTRGTEMKACLWIVCSVFDLRPSLSFTGDFTFDDLLSHSVVELHLSRIGLEDTVKVVGLPLQGRGGGDETGQHGRQYIYKSIVLQHGETFL